MKIWLWMGGESSEREVSRTSGAAVSLALRERGHEVWAFDPADGRLLPEHSSPAPPAVVSAIEAQDPAAGPTSRLARAAERMRDLADVAFLALHGGAGENGTLQALLASAGMPYTGSGPAASAVAMDKAISKWVMEAIGVPTPDWRLLDAGEAPTAPPMETPLVVKPAAEGSSVGVEIVTEREAWGAALASARRAAGTGRVLVERFIPGRELTVGVLGRRALPIVEIRPHAGFYDYRNKYTRGRTDYRAPADLGGDEAARLQAHAVRLFEALGCRGMARIDFRFTEGAEAYCLEANTIPGLTSLSLLPMAAGAAGLAFGEMLEEICGAAGL